MTVAERQALMHSFRAISRRNPNAVPWSSALVWVAVVVHRFRQVFAVRVHRVVHCLTFRSVTTRFQLEAFAWIRKATGEIRSIADSRPLADRKWAVRSEEHTSELQSLMRISYAVFCLKKKKNHKII